MTKGMLAAAGIHAIENHWERMGEDHENARVLGRGLSALGFSLTLPVHTNQLWLSSSSLLSPSFPLPSLPLLLSLALNPSASTPGQGQTHASYQGQGQGLYLREELARHHTGQRMRVARAETSTYPQRATAHEGSSQVPYASGSGSGPGSSSGSKGDEITFDELSDFCRPYGFILPRGQCTARLVTHLQTTRSDILRLLQLLHHYLSHCRPLH